MTPLAPIKQRACRTPNAACCGIPCAIFSQTLAGRPCRGTVGQRRGHRGIVARSGRPGPCCARRQPAEAGLREILLVFEELGRASCPAPLLGAVAANLALAGQQSNATRAMLEDLHQGKAMIALALGAFDGDPAAGQVDMRDDALSGKFLLWKARRPRRTFLSSPASPRASRWSQAAPPGLKMQVTPGLAVPPFSELTFETHRPRGWTFRPKRLPTSRWWQGSPAPGARLARRSGRSSWPSSTPRSENNSASSSANSRRCSTSSPIA